MEQDKLRREVELWEARERVGRRAAEEEQRLRAQQPRPGDQVCAHIEAGLVWWRIGTPACRSSGVRWRLDPVTYGWGLRNVRPGQIMFAPHPPVSRAR